MSDPRDLCVVDDVKVLMQKTGPNADSQDALIQSLITDVSCEIMEDYGREIVPGGPEQIAYTGATRTFEYQWSDQYPGEAFVDLRPYDLAVDQPTPITVCADTDQVTVITLSTQEWRLWPQPPEHGVYMAIKVLPLNVSVGLIGWHKRQIQVTGNWGMPSVPRKVKSACAQTVVYRLTGYPGSRRPDQTDALAQAATPRSYPLSAVDLLRSIKRMTV